MLPIVKKLESCASFEPEIIMGNVVLRYFTLPNPGDFIDGHTHDYHHAFLELQSSMGLEQRHPDGLFVKDSLIMGDKMLINKNVNHKLISTAPTQEEALEYMKTLSAEEKDKLILKYLTLPAKGVCVFALRDIEGHVAEELAEHGNPTSAIIRSAS